MGYKDTNTREDRLDRWETWLRIASRKDRGHITRHQFLGDSTLGPEGWSSCRYPIYSVKRRCRGE